MNSAKAKVTERTLQETASDFLGLDGWRRIRTDLPHLRGLGVQERGIADDLYIRYAGASSGERVSRCDEILWIEWKAPNGVTAQHQLAWHEAERARGALTWIAGIDFPATIEGFQTHYFHSGLARKVRLAR